MAGIESVSLEASSGNTVYTLNGQRMQNSKTLAKGIYIINGKKYLVKR